MKKFFIIFSILIVTLFILVFFLSPVFMWLFFGFSFVYILAFILYKKKKIIIYFVFFIIMIFGVFNSIFLFNTDKTSSSFVIHAGGGINNNKYLNVEEGLYNSIEKKAKFIELDFLYSIDNKIICSHNFEYLYPYNINNRIDYETFKNFKILGKYKGLTLEKVFSVLEKVNDIKIVFDTKEEDCIKIIKDIIDFSKNYNIDIFSVFIIQIYDFSQYEIINDLGFNEIWYTNYKSLYSIAKINNFFKDKNNMTTIVLSYNNFMAVKMFCGKTQKKIAVHTINNKNTYNFLSNRGVDYIFTDYLG